MTPFPSAADDAEQRRLGFHEFSRGAAIGSTSWRRTIAKEFEALALGPGITAAEAQEMREHLWAGLLDQRFHESGRDRNAAAAERWSAPWKIALARELRQSGVPYAWIAVHLNIGCANSVRAYVNAKNGGTIDYRP